LGQGDEAFGIALSKGLRTEIATSQ